MSSPTHSSSHSAPFDLSAWRNVPTVLMVLGGAGALLGAFLDVKHAAFSYLTAYMFFLSFGLGGLILTILHHLFDASWSVPVRRLNEHLANLLPMLAFLFLPIIINVLTAGNDNLIYHWMVLIKEGKPDHAVTAKYPLFTVKSFLAAWVFCGVVWTVLARGLRKHSLDQDKTGSIECTRSMRRYSAAGVFLFAITTTAAAIMWMKALQHEWFSTMYGVYYFAGSTWTTIATIYFLTWLLQRQGPLREVVKYKTFYFLGSLLFAFTVFYAYVTFFQYFIIWNANMPEETFFYVAREHGVWFWVSMVVIFGHFFGPFLTLLRIDVKLMPIIMIPLVAWVWLMHYVDMTFNIMPIMFPDGPHFHWLDFACLAFIGGLLARIFLKSLNSHPVFPQKDPRFAEAMDIHVPEGEVLKAAARGVKATTGGKH